MACITEKKGNKAESNANYTMTITTLGNVFVRGDRMQEAAQLVNKLSLFARDLEKIPACRKVVLFQNSTLLSL